MLLRFFRWLGRTALHRKWRILDARAIAAWDTPKVGRVLSGDAAFAELTKMSVDRLGAPVQAAEMPYQQQVIHYRRVFAERENELRELYNRQLEAAQRASAHLYVPPPVPADRPGYTELTR